VGVGCGTETAPNHDVKGNVEAAAGDVLTGWACANGLGDSIGVHVYAGGPAGQGGTMVAAAVANQPSEPAVANACGVGGGAFRFAIALTDDMKARFGGQALFVHGLSPVGGDNKLIGNSGVVPMPNPVVRQVASVTTQPAGFFQPPNNGTIYYSNGVDAFCGKESWDDYLNSGGRADLGNVAHPAALPTGMRNDGTCALVPTPAGFFKAGGDQVSIFWSNGGDAYCHVPNWPTFLRMGGISDQANVRTLERSPRNMRNDGQCYDADAAALAAAAQAQAQADQLAQAQARAAAEAQARANAAQAAADAQVAAFLYRTAPMYRFYQNGRGEHFLTSNFDEANNPYWTYEGVPFNFVVQNAPGTHGIYRCLTNQIYHFLSTDAGCEGQRFEGTYGYVYDAPAAGRTAIYRLYHPISGDHLTSTNMIEGIGAGYVLEGPQGYVQN
jgi:hypothetical protein